MLGLLAAGWGLAALYIQRRLLEPIRALARCTAQLSAGRLEFPIPRLESRQEFAVLAGLESFRQELAGGPA